MPSFFSIPLELREDIYRKLLNSPLVSKPSLRPRQRISKEQQSAKESAFDSVSSATNSTKEASDEGAVPKAMISGLTTQELGETEYYDGEESVRYSLAKPLPPTHSLLHTCRQVRAEMLDIVRRSELRYKIRLAFREDKDTLYPTWISVPALSNRIDVLEVEIRVRQGKTSSLFSTAAGDDDEREYGGDSTFGGLVLLRRFLERGVYFLSKKKAQNITIGLLLLHIVPKDLDREPDELFEVTSNSVNDLLLDNDDDYIGEELIRFFAERIDRFSYQVGEQRKDWNMRDVISERDRLNVREIK